MTRRTGLAIVAGTLVALFGVTNVTAQDGFWERTSPFRFMRSRTTTAPPSAPGPLEVAEPGLARRQIRPPTADGPQFERREQAHANGGWLGDRSETGQPPTLEELRAHLISRGIDPDRLDERIARMREARAHGLKTGQAGESDDATSAEQVRTELPMRGADRATGETRLADAHEARFNNGRVGRQVQGNVGLERAQVQTRLVRQGVSPEALNERLGKIYRDDGSTPGMADRSVGAGVGRMRTRR
ncbi:MAG: hypothetical protein ACYC6N_20225 [Pirellulaceae bacterium]